MKPVLTLLFFLFVFNTAFADTKKHDFKGAAVAEVYKEASGDKLWIYRFDPANYKPESDSRPAVVFFFGGGWNGGTVGQFEQQAKYLAARGVWLHLLRIIELSKGKKRIRMHVLQTVNQRFAGSAKMPSDLGLILIGSLPVEVLLVVT